jgi:hypothetical protein
MSSGKSAISNLELSWYLLDGAIRLGNLYHTYLKNPHLEEKVQAGLVDEARKTLIEALERVKKPAWTRLCRKANRSFTNGCPFRGEKYLSAHEVLDKVLSNVCEAWLRVFKQEQPWSLAYVIALNEVDTCALKSELRFEVTKVEDLAAAKRIRRRRTPDRRAKPLTPRQAEAMQMVGEHKGNYSAAARAMGVTPQRVRALYGEACQKLGISATKKGKAGRLPTDRRGQPTVAAESEEHD